MARIRTIKPEFCESETIGKLSRDARLLFIQLWTFVDDEGRARAASRMLASRLFPYDDDAPSAIEAWMSELEQVGCVRRYQVGGDTYLDIPNWLKHQKIDRPTPSKIPPFDAGSTAPREPSRALATDLGPGPGTLDQVSDATASAPVDPSIAEREFFSRGKEVAGQAAGGLLANLLKAKGGNVALARAVVEEASQKQNPREFIAGAVKHGSQPRKSHVPESKSLSAAGEWWRERLAEPGAVPLLAIGGH